MQTRPSSAMIESLEADGPFDQFSNKLTLFGRLVGSWDIEGTHFDAAGNVTKHQTGEWHFGWVLEGRAVQDVIISPSRASRDPKETSREYGTTIRAYDPKIDAWRVAFVAPVYGAIINLIARERGDEIWLEGQSPVNNNLLRWTFSEFTEQRVLWQGFESADQGLTWTRLEQIILRRR